MPPRTEKLTLPAEPGKLWARVRQAIHRLPEEPGTGPVPPHLGGGTILASRWGHRWSADIDIFLPGRINLLDLQQNDERQIEKLVGGKIEEAGPWQIKLAFAESKLDISITPPRPESGHRMAIVDKKQEMVLSSTQILRGKLARADEGLVRDAFDITAAARAEPDALAAAISMLPQATADGIRWRYRMTSQQLAERYEDQIKDVPAEYRVEPTELGAIAAAAISHHRYEKLKISIDNAELVVEKQTAGGALPTQRWNAESQVREALTATGVYGHLDANGPINSNALDKAIRTTLAREESRTVFESNNPETLAYIRKCGQVGPPPARPRISTSSRGTTGRGRGYEH